MIKPDVAPYDCFSKENAIVHLEYIGNIKILDKHKTGFLCSERCPGNVIIKTYDDMVLLRDEGKVVLSGFQSPVEKDCLDILLRGSQPIIIAVAKSLQSYKLPEALHPAFTQNRLLILSPFLDKPKRISKQSSMIRNRFILEIGDERYIPWRR
jgi:hypothetical protein